MKEKNQYAINFYKKFRIVNHNGENFLINIYTLS